MVDSDPPSPSNSTSLVMSKTTRHLSCERCRVRKTKCSREPRCRTCLEKGVPCVWLRTGPSRTVKEAELADAQAEITRLRSVVRNLTNRLNSVVHEQSLQSQPKFKVYSDDLTEFPEFTSDYEYPSFKEYYDVPSTGTPNSNPPSPSSTASPTQPTFSNLYQPHDEHMNQTLVALFEPYDQATFDSGGYAAFPPSPNTRTALEAVQPPPTHSHHSHLEVYYQQSGPKSAGWTTRNRSESEQRGQGW